MQDEDDDNRKMSDHAEAHNEPRYIQIHSACAMLFHSVWYERLVLVAILSNCAYLMTYNTPLRASGGAMLTSTSQVVQNVSLGSMVALENVSLASTMPFNLSNPHLERSKAKLGAAWQIFSMDKNCWWHIFFMLDLVGQLVSEGSVADFVAQGERLWDLFVTLGTSMALLVELSSIDQSSLQVTLNFLHSLAILRLFRTIKHRLLLPL